MSVLFVCVCNNAMHVMASKGTGCLGLMCFSWQLRFCALFHTNATFIWAERQTNLFMLFSWNCVHDWDPFAILKGTGEWKQKQNNHVGTYNINICIFVHIYVYVLIVQEVRTYLHCANSCIWLRVCVPVSRGAVEVSSVLTQHQQ